MAPQRQAKRKQSSLPSGIGLRTSYIRESKLTPFGLGYKEDTSRGAMLRFEDSLPRLPVPTLEETCKRYLKSVHPLLSQQEFESTKRAVTDFQKPGGQGEVLQKRLLARREDPKHRNWIYEWWNSAAYLVSIVPAVNIRRT